MSSIMSEQQTWENVMDIADDERTPVFEMDSALFFMEMMEEDYIDGAEDDRLSCVIRSFEAEINTGVRSNGGDGVLEMEPIGMDDILSDLDSSCGSLRPMGYIGHEGDGLHLEWMDMDVAGAGDSASSWCLGEDEMVGYGDLIDYYGAGYIGDSYGDQVSSPLWQ